MCGGGGMMDIVFFLTLTISVMLTIYSILLQLNCILYVIV